VDASAPLDGSPNPADRTTEQQILAAALEVFAKKGYHGSSIREIALVAGVSVPGLYHHFVSKRDLLERIMDDTMDRLIVTTLRAREAAGDDPVDRLGALVAAHVRFHIDFQSESFVGNTELRSLVSPGRERILRKRDRQRAIFDAAIDAGREAGVFTTAFPIETGRALVAMCTAVATWYRKDRELKPDEIVSRYRRLALQLVGCNAERLAGRAEPAGRDMSIERGDEGEY
jgi:AcrR family transcriptional regulator